jgi:hypothetical protein
MKRHTDPYRGVRIMIMTGAIALPLVLLFAGWAYFAAQ